MPLFQEPFPLLGFVLISCTFYVSRIHVTCAVALQEKGDYDKAVKHYIDGKNVTFSLKIITEV